MARIEINCEIKTYPDNGEKHKAIKVKNHWNYNNRVHLIIGKEEHIVIGSDIIKAIQKCMDHS